MKGMLPAACEKSSFWQSVRLDQNHLFTRFPCVPHRCRCPAALLAMIHRQQKISMIDKKTIPFHHTCLAEIPVDIDNRIGLLQNLSIPAI